MKADSPVALCLTVPVWAAQASPSFPTRPFKVEVVPHISNNDPGNVLPQLNCSPLFSSLEKHSLGCGSADNAILRVEQETVIDAITPESVSRVQRTTGIRKTGEFHSIVSFFVQNLGDCGPPSVQFLYNCHSCVAFCFCACSYLYFYRFL